MKLTPTQLRTVARVAERGWASIDAERIEILRGPGGSVAVSPDGHRGVRIYVLANGDLSADGKTAA